VSRRRRRRREEKLLTGTNADNKQNGDAWRESRTQTA
jgi:hypothetical protein